MPHERDRGAVVARLLPKQQVVGSTPTGRSVERSMPRMNDWKSAWRTRTREWAVSVLGGCCATCKSQADLQFDHVDARLKEFDISVGIRDGYGRARLQAELEKCQLLCSTHHKEKSRANGDHAGGQNKILNPKHGTAARYGGSYRCRCDLCRKWKVDYRAKIVDSLGHMRK